MNSRQSITPQQADEVCDRKKIDNLEASFEEIFFDYSIIGGIIGCILIALTVMRSYGVIIDSVSLNGLVIIRFIGLICINIIINQTLLKPKLIVRDTLFETPWYRLALTGIGLIACMMLFDQPMEKLTGCFAVASICMDRDHRWATLLALDVFVVVIVMLLLKQQGAANTYAIYLYYLLVIVTMTKIVNQDKDIGQRQESTKEEGQVQ